MSDRTLSCALCGIEFVPIRRGPGRPSTFCSDDCKREHVRLRDAAAYAKRRDATSRVVTKVCVVCGTNFQATPLQSRRVMACSSDCKKRLARQRSARIIATNICDMCGVEYGATGSDVRRGRRFCSVACSKAHAVATQSNRRICSCEVCGIEFTRKVSDFNRDDGVKRGRFCSKVCQGVWRRQQPKTPKKPQPKPAPRSRVYFRECVECGRIFCARGANAKRCSTQCKIDAEGARVKDLYAMATQFIDGKYLGAQWRKALIEYLVERDGDKCGICNRKIDITLKSGTRGSRKGPSVDHIIPRSLGGTDDLTNLRLACWGCNHSRGNRGGNEQLMLVG